LLPPPTGLNILMMEATSTYETSVNFYHTRRRNNPEDSHLHDKSVDDKEEEERKEDKE
jgi:hypothetical protein